MRALDAAEHARGGLARAGERADPLRLGVEGVLQVLERQRVGEHGPVAARQLAGRGAAREQHARRQRAGRREPAAQDVAAAVQRLGRLAHGAVAVDRGEVEVPDRGVVVESHDSSPTRRSAARTPSLVSGSSVVFSAGGSPPMSRIHAAWRASTETIVAALASVSGLRFAAWPL